MESGWPIIFSPGAADKSPNQTSNILPLALDMVPRAKKELVLGRLLDSVVKEWDYHLSLGTMGEIDRGRNELPQSYYAGKHRRRALLCLRRAEMHLQAGKRWSSGRLFSADSP